MTPHRFHPQKLPESACLSLIGMAGAGKTTIGQLLAQTLGWAHLDTDRLIEAYYGAPLQKIFNGLGLKSFLDAEEKIVALLAAKRCVISTGGSVIYGPNAVARLKNLGPVIYLETGLETIRDRVADAADRGLAIAPGQTIDQLYAERQPLYEAAADLLVETDDCRAASCVATILGWLETAP